MGGGGHLSGVGLKTARVKPKIIKRFYKERQHVVVIEGHLKTVSGVGRGGGGLDHWPETILSFNTVRDFYYTSLVTFFSEEDKLSFLKIVLISLY